LTDTSKTVRRDVVGIFNFDLAATMTENYSLKKLGLSSTATYVGFDFWANKFVPPFTGTLSFSVPPTESRIIAVRPVSGEPMAVSTSRHISQGIYDILDENWDLATKTLRGTSRVVGGDPYELRIYASRGAAGNWNAVSSAVSAADASAGVVAGPPAQNGPEVRVTFKPGTANRQIDWSIVFQ
jgi:hypothetical protein